MTLLVWMWGATAANAVTPHVRFRDSQVANGSEGTLQVNLRKLWEDHVSWTRMYIMSATANAPDKMADALSSGNMRQFPQKAAM